ncbi:hypothetical protein CBL_02003 [Carabus blaptoides fortunei]
MDNIEKSSVVGPTANEVPKTDESSKVNIIESDITCANNLIEQNLFNKSADSVATKTDVEFNPANVSVKEEYNKSVLERKGVAAEDKEQLDGSNETEDGEPNVIKSEYVKLEEYNENRSVIEKQSAKQNMTNCNDDDGEDLPENFFDDFSNNDFMAGLDIVDDWIDDGDGDKNHFADDYYRDDIETRNQDNSDKKHKQSSNNVDKRDGSSSRHYRDRQRNEERDHYRRDRHSRDRHSRDRHLRHRDRSRERERHQRRSRDRDYERSRDGRRSRNRDHNRPRDERPKEQGRSHERDKPDHAAKPIEKGKRNDELNADDANDRRDPEKTKRDIQRDKIRCAKDHEIRVFQEQLKVAETGLVPPGTELDKRSRSKSRDKARDKSRERRTSPEYRYRRREYSRYERDRSSSPRPRRKSRTLTAEEIFRRNDDLRLRIREKRRERYLNELSPVSETKMSRSPSLDLSFVSNVSDREMWLRNRDRYRSRYGRSCSPISSNSLSDHGSPKRKRSKKTSFMEEIKRKLADRPEERPPSFNMFQNQQYNNAMHVIDPPRPVPPPLMQTVTQFHTQMPMNIPFQHNQPVYQPPAMCPNPYQTAPMVMGHHHPGNVMPNVLGAPMNIMMPPNMMNMQHQQVQEPPMAPNINPAMNQVPTPPVQPGPVDTNVFRNDTNLKPCVSDSQALTKLFEEQKISLSDYLSVSAKPIDVQTINVHKKIQVISKCQEVIKTLSDGNGAKLCGRFFPTVTTLGAEKPADGSMKFRSPLRKLNPVRFMFTTPYKRSAQEDSSKVMLNKLLTVCGFSILPDSVPRNAPTPNTSSSSSLFPPPPQLSSTGITPVPSPVRAPPPAPQPPVLVPQPPILIKRTSVSVQTDPVKCQICEIRSARQFNTCNTQTTEVDVHDEGTQVCQEDLRESCVTFTPRGILKNSLSSVQSISHMTTAQLLALQQESSAVPQSRNETFPVARGNMDRFAPALRNSAMDSRSSFSNPTLDSPSYSDSSYLSRNTSSSLGMNKGNSFIGSVNTSPFKASFNNNMDKLPFNNRPFGISTPGRNMGITGDNFPSNPWNNEGMGSRYPVSNDSNDRYSPEQAFNDNGNVNYMNRNISNVTGRGMSSMGLNSASYGMQNRPFYGQRGGQH